ncbi:MAG: class I SAM-dependent methyltransferase [Myxococcota bacterium]
MSRPPDPAAHAKMLGDRARKNERRLRRRLGDTEAYRVYDWDIPEVRAAVDRFGPDLVLHGYDRRQTDELPDYWPSLAAGVQGALGAREVFIKRRRTGSGVRYERLSREGVRRPVQEDGLSFELNLSDYIDVGLFLDHRPLRRWFRAHAQGRRVLNLFAYTGSFSVAAAAGGAARVTTVDLSGLYLDWARRNLEANELPEGELVEADARTWLDHQARGPWDLIFIDPPSRSASWGGDSLELLDDHPQLLTSAAQHLAPGGTILFSTNHQAFEFRGGKGWEEITDWTVPPDFRQRPHRAFRWVAL